MQMNIKEKGLVFQKLLDAYNSSMGLNHHDFNYQTTQDLMRLMEEYYDKLDLLQIALTYSNKCTSDRIYYYIKRVMDDWNNRGIKTPNDVSKFECKSKEDLKPFYDYKSRKANSASNNKKNNDLERAQLITEIHELNKGYNRPIPEDKPLELWTIEQLKKVKSNIILLNKIYDMIKKA